MNHRSNLILVVAFFAVASNVFSQTDRTFPNVGAEFSLAWPCMDPINGSWTAYETQTYQAQPSVQFIGLDWGEFGPSIGRIAVDGERVLLWGTSGEYLPIDSIVTLYDFGLLVGDTAYFDNYYFYDHAVIQQIETVQILGRERRRFHLNNDDVWLEGIGSLFGVLRPIWITPLGCADPAYTFCAEYEDDLDEPYTWCSEIILTVAEPWTPVLAVGPNPNDGHFTLTGTAQGDHYRLNDAAGRTFGTGTVSGTSEAFDLSRLSEGIYFLRVRGSAVKVVVQ
ncbi:MAG TPA: T9SS type A sorting domain-containing protein [Flavobacteriales bacterium]|jgi:hypothetical protein|nr:T9SS type A sorting domain-containing protein [Flavobacteriales bacterium]MBK6549000.1 T9SS type A sorting domain-containing protein [Flavobacteriales bacterium]MBK7100804.1 T9SS type A sorting domain-containing protein [Flavobacteriales bacterium]MBK7111491.1 T9SS type A sorting domain-containing protein [Flavobacteriales bacterium]MBK7484153.1 T9SS type A sorting domain-containing protein [Flavobacteriales bacterium]